MALVPTLTEHKSKVNKAVFNRDGTLLATASDDNTVKLWRQTNDNTYELWQTLAGDGGHKDWVYGVSFAPDGRLVSSSHDKTIKLWQPDDTGKFTLIRTLQGHTDGVLAVEFSPEGDSLVSGSWDKTIRFWLNRETSLPRLVGHSDRINSISFSPDGKHIATGSRDETIKLWTREGKLQATFDGHSGKVQKVDFSPDGRLIASASTDCTVNLWQIDGTLVRTLVDPSLTPDQLPEDCTAPATHGDRVYSLAFSPDGNRLATASRNGTVSLWSLKGELLKTWIAHDNPLTQRINSLAFSRDGNLLASAGDDREIRLWKVTLAPARAGAFAIGADASSHRDRLNVALQTTIPLPQNQQTGHRSYITEVSFSPRKIAIAFPPTEAIASAGWDNAVKLWALDGRLLANFYVGHNDSVNSVRFTPNGRLLASGNWDGTVKLWSLDGNGEGSAPLAPKARLVKTLYGHDRGVVSVSFSPDGKILTSASDDRTAILWNLDLDDLIVRGCDWVEEYLQTNPNVAEADRKICQAGDRP
ncbi:MAG: WD40 repeat domain-containing protein [Coleofasciculaceae cyanobacterium SM2_3_26]|nr:WD40 repeat domain-containing protein [Coleofasciculaceae cyanobacterium SM2_3_26]